MQRGESGRYEFTSVGGEQEKSGRRAGSALRVHDALKARPTLSMLAACRVTKLSFPAVSSAMEVLADTGIARELTGKRRNRLFVDYRYCSATSAAIEVEEMEGPDRVARAFALYLALSACAAAAHALPLEKIELPPGFEIAVYAGDVPRARSMALGPKGTLFVGTRDRQVYAIVDRDGDQRADQVHTVAKGLRQPNGVAVRDGALYVAEISRILRLDDIENRLADPPQPVVVYDKLPQDKHHGWKFIAFGPDGLLYVPVGAPCNICEREDPYAGITRMTLDGSGYEVFARGIRNTVGFDWHPQTKVLWFTDNGRDYLGDDRPPDELNRAPETGMHFGYPYCHGDSIADPDFGEGRSCDKYADPAAKLGPHVAALGMRFYTGTMFPPEYRNRIFIAEHGSWNRSKKIGYRVTTVRVADGKASDYSPFATGWLQRERAWGRPVDVQQMADGALLVSDDEAGAIYRISYRTP